MNEIDIPFPVRTATLLRELDKRLMVWLRDGRTLIGILRSIDQFANLVLHRTVERIHVGSKYGDLPVGVTIIRGENVILLGEIDPFKEMTQPLTEVSLTEILSLQKAEQEKKFERGKVIRKALRERGISTALEAVALADRDLNFLE
ncbi:hypothetical protein V9T40_014294 [Parthenolecanium corni]|uniref:U6 snRNA-associated Sm-like protein LSm1 n=1 Tax=Parthenolecanium corni TaxID=536013 RepID=A0AAN9T4S0_9HEMI